MANVMKPIFTRRTFVVSLAALFPTLLFGGEPEKHATPESAAAFAKGEEDARKDITAKKLGWESIGLPPPWHREYARMLEQRYQITIRSVGDCTPDSVIWAHARGYNQVMKAEIEKRFGKGILEKMAEEARAHSEENQPQNE